MHGSDGLCTCGAVVGKGGGQGGVAIVTPCRPRTGRDDKKRGNFWQCIVGYKAQGV
jgi:hypothetical protein